MRVDGNIVSMPHAMIVGRDSYVVSVSHSVSVATDCYRVSVATDCYRVSVATDCYIVSMVDVMRVRRLRVRGLGMRRRAGVVAWKYYIAIVLMDVNRLVIAVKGCGFDSSKG